MPARRRSCCRLAASSTGVVSASVTIITFVFSGSAAFSLSPVFDVRKRENSASCCRQNTLMQLLNAFTSLMFVLKFCSD
uniref:Uncharacterized protein n=1 Tax=Yersinia enterocolitica TaxID=630 RepID=B0RKT1_YEREN|nr:hypothetical protein [Yersinia enterocolitica]